MEKIFHEGKYYNDTEMKEIVLDYYRCVFSDKFGRHVQMQKIMPSTLSSDAVILDYGCGMGGISSMFYDKYKCRVDAVDISDNELRKAKAAFGDNKKINFKNLAEFDFPDEYYDLIFSSQVIEHVHNCGNYLYKINKMLKKDGLLIIGLPNIVNLNYLIQLMFFSAKKAKDILIEVDD
ncbi:class I SAM-dependent methyltransferase [Campylobacter sp. MOP51]|uniref:class I SAM-dependent methyltransferase n=1 Tax=Campylobacter canis TaxID=3378588 RepID=UPI003C4894E1